MKGAGWFLIVAGVVWIFLKTGLEYWSAKKAGRPGPEGVVFPGPDAMAKLLQAPYGVGVAMLLIGATLFLADAGVNVSFSPASPSPSPS